MPQFDVATYGSQIFWLTTIFGLIYFTISRIIAPKAEKVFKHREDVLEDHKNSALTIAKHTEKLKQDYDKDFKELLEVLENISSEASNVVDKMMLEKQNIFENQLRIENANALNDEQEMKMLFKADKNKVCLELAEFILEKITQKSPNRLLLEQCYYKKIE
jgi:F-type H+-transporting ATPase subunit b